MKIKDNIKTAIFCVVFPSCLYGILKLRHINIPDWYGYVWGALAAIAFFALINPAFGSAIHKIGSKVGASIGHFIARIILFLVFVFTVIPTGLLMKIVKRDRLRLKKPNVTTYWINNEQKEQDYEYQF